MSKWEMVKFETFSEEILDRLDELESQIQNGLKDLRGML